MFDYIEALAALAEHGTMRRAALALHITQSAISKRIDQLENRLDQRMIQPRGRRVELTPAGERFLTRARPLLFELKEVMRTEQAEATGRLVIDLSVSVLISWGASALAKARAALPNLELQLNANHASVAVERVRSGETMLAIVQGESTNAPDLAAEPLFQQQVVLVPSGLKPIRLKRGSKITALAIEAHTEAWKFIEKGLRTLKSQAGVDIGVQAEVQSFSAIAQLARAGFGHGLVPRDVARTLGITDGKLVKLPADVSIPVSLVGRRSTMALPLVRQLYGQLLRYVPAQ